MSAAEERRVSKPEPIGLAASFGFGDRLGLATPGHVAALVQTRVDVVPVFAQQSARELVRTGRTFADVLDCAAEGAASAGWTGPFGADGDHLKEPDQVRAAAAAGYTMFTLDPSDHVDVAGATLAGSELEARFRSLPWHALEDAPDDVLRRYRHDLDLADTRLPRTDVDIARAAVKYVRAVAHAARLAALAPSGSDIEVSVDETPAATTAFEHAFVVGELHRRDVRPTSLAPRFPGSFEKGIEHVGSVDEFTNALRRHVAVQDALGPYKLSLHSGSDKLTLYGAFAEITRGRFHVKTAGTSYLEALRTVGEIAPELLLEIWSLARERYAVDRASYELTAEVGDVPLGLAEERPTALLDERSARRILHVTYGSVLSDDRLAAALRAALLADGGAAYERALANHLGAHLAALAT